MEYPSPATPRTPYTHSRIPSQYTPSVDAYSREFDDARVHGSNTHHDTNNTSLVNQEHNAVYNPYLNMPSFDDQTTLVANLGQQANGGHSVSYIFPRNTSLRSNPGNNSLPRSLPSTSLQFDYGHRSRYEHVPTTPPPSLERTIVTYP